MNPITKEHLLAACNWADGLSTPNALAARKYVQANWSCGTACCIHGAAHIIARGEDTTTGPTTGDYEDLAPGVRDGVLSVLASAGGTPDLVRRVLAGDISVGAGATVGAGAMIGNLASIGVRAHVGYGAMIGAGATVGDGARVGVGASVGARAYVGDGAMIGAGASLGIEVVVRPGASIGDGETVAS